MMAEPTTAAWRQTPMHMPAYNAVTARQTFGVKPAPVTETMPPSTPKPAKVKIEWPAPVREYVQRSFDPAYTIPGIEKVELEAKLRQIISNATEREELHTIDWANLPLPQLYIQEERKAAATMNGWMQNTFPSPQTSYTNHSSPPLGLKRKSDSEMLIDQTEENLPPWRKKTNNRNPFEDRLTYANKEQADRAEKRQRKNETTISKNASKFSQADLEKRKQRFGLGKPGNRASPPWSSRPQDNETNQGPVVGTCQDLEKKYFRLTAPPKPETVRPQHILEQTLDFLKKKWRKENNYGYICDQFKSLRQDLTVQHIKNNFTITVYEIHARIALEKGDLGEYNQCQTQLRALYSQIPGGHPDEFLAYRILYFIYTCNRSDMNDLLAELTPADKKKPAVQHALNVRSALALGNYHKFFQLYLSAPSLGAYLMDMFIERERLAALANICRAFKPSVPARYLTEELGFESDSECLEFLCAKGAGTFLVETPDGVTVSTQKDIAQLFENLRKRSFSKVDIKGQK